MKLTWVPVQGGLHSTEGRRKTGSNHSHMAWPAMEAIRTVGKRKESEGRGCSLRRALDGIRRGRVSGDGGCLDGAPLCGAVGRPVEGTKSGKRLDPTQLPREADMAPVFWDGPMCSSVILTGLPFPLKGQVNWSHPCMTFKAFVFHLNELGSRGRMGPTQAAERMLCLPG